MKALAALIMGTFTAFVFFAHAAVCHNPTVSYSSIANEVQINSFMNELHDAKLRISRLEKSVEEGIENMNAKFLILEKHENLIDEAGAKIEYLRSVLSSFKEASLYADRRISSLEEEVRLLWGELQDNNFELRRLESMSQETDERLKTVTLKAGKFFQMADMINEQWIQIRHLEQALEIAMRGSMIQRHVHLTKYSFSKLLDKMYRNYLQKLFQLLDPLLFGMATSFGEYLSGLWRNLQIFFSVAKRHHHELQGYVKKEMGRSKVSAALSNDEVVFFMASTLILLPLCAAWNLFHTHFTKSKSKG